MRGVEYERDLSRESKPSFDSKYTNDSWTDCWICDVSLRVTCVANHARSPLPQITLHAFLLYISQWSVAGGKLSIILAEARLRVGGLSAGMAENAGRPAQRGLFQEVNNTRRVIHGKHTAQE